MSGVSEVTHDHWQRPWLSGERRTQCRSLALNRCRPGSFWGPQGLWALAADAHGVCPSPQYVSQAEASALQQQQYYQWYQQYNYAYPYSYYYPMVSAGPGGAGAALGCGRGVGTGARASRRPEDSNDKFWKIFRWHVAHKIKFRVPPGTCLPCFWPLPSPRSFHRCAETS